MTTVSPMHTCTHQEKLSTQLDIYIVLHACMHTHTHAHAHNTYMYMQACTYACMHVCTHARTHTHTHTHTLLTDRELKVVRWLQAQITTFAVSLITSQPSELQSCSITFQNTQDNKD